MAIRIESQSEPIPGYKLLERLGGGGFGEVWKVEAPGGLLKAIKIVYGDINTADAEGVRRAEQELKAMKRVQSVRHPYLLSLERYDIIEGRLLIVMELADRNLWDRFRECRSQGLQGLPREELLRYIEEASEVLDLMNVQHQLQHLDIKPQNLFLVHNHVKVADFGLVKDLEGLTGTVTGGVTPVYAAPETFDGVVTRFCDQYSLAMVYQELLTGIRPFTGTSVQQLIMQHLHGTPNLGPLPAEDREAIARALAKKPEDRHPSCGDMARALRQAGMTQTVPSRPVAPPVQQPPPAPVRLEPVFPTPTPNFARPMEREIEFSVTPRPPEPPPSSWTTEVQPADDLSVSRVAPAEITGDGVLYPALLIGIGQVGLKLLQSAREALLERFTSFDSLPHIRYLYLDTDAQTAHEATQGGAGGPLEGSQILLARLNRPGHYLKPRDGRVRVETWFDPQMLYRIPRTPETTGMRALGRLAFIDNYRPIIEKLRSELEAITNAEALAKADRLTRLGIRSNRPRVYLLTSLAGGTGSGTFIDLAYVVRNQLRRWGYSQPEVVGLFLVPQVDRNPAMTLALGNTYAALTELNHYSSADVVFNARYDERESPVSDREAPFERAIVLPLVEEKEKNSSMAFGLAGDFLYRELATPLGRAAATGRAAYPVSAEHASQMNLQTFGMYRLAWPRRLLLRRTARNLCFRLATSWTSKDSTPLREAVHTWLTERWERHQLGLEHVIARLQESCQKALGQAPETVFNSLTEMVAPKNKRVKELNAVAALEAMDKLEQILGRPEANATSRRSVLLADTLEKAGQALVKEWGQKVAQLASRLVEEPRFRLAGAEEAINQMAEIMEQTLARHEPLCQELAERAVEAHKKITSLLGVIQINPGGGRRTAALIADLGEVLRVYPKWRYQYLVLVEACTIFANLTNQLADQMREVDFCRTRLLELVRAFEEQGSISRAGGKVPGKYMLPAGCRSVKDAADGLINAVTPDDLVELDKKMQVMIQQQFTALINVCMSSTNLLKNLETAMLQQAETFISPRLVGANVVEMFLAKHPQEDEAIDVIGRSFEETAPELARVVAARLAEVRVLAVPGGPLGEKFQDLAVQALPDTKLEITSSPDDIVFYREQPNLPIARLEQLGAVAQDAYRQANAAEHFTPHCRTDIVDWLEVTPG